MSHILEQAFGTKNLDLYGDILKVSKSCTPAALRKGYYQQALLYHPDKNKSKDATLKFQAISWAYQYLKDPKNRSAYDEDGSLPSTDDDCEMTEDNQWKQFFDSIFGKVSLSKISDFAAKYKMSEEEEKDVLLNYEKFKGSFSKMLQHVILSEEVDLQRWMEDYIRPAIEKGAVADYSKTLERTLNRINNKKMANEGSDDMVDVDKTDTEDSEDQYAASNKATPGHKRKISVFKSKPTRTKKASRKGEDGLISAICKNRLDRASNSSLSTRYGVSMTDDDPLDDESFAKLRSKFNKK